MKGLGRLKGKVAIVTGGGSGIGAGISRVFAREGAAVVVTDRDPVAGSKTVSDIEAEANQALFVQADVTVETEIIAMIDHAVAVFGGLDILINNAGVGVGRTVEESDNADWDRIIGINARGTFLAMKHAIPRLRARGGGSIINIGSLWALRGNPSYAVYHASKGAIRQITKSAALAHCADGIRINAVHPGFIETPASASDAVAQDLATVHLGAMGRWGKPEEVAYGCLFLASDEARFITGIDLPIDGGNSA